MSMRRGLRREGGRDGWERTRKGRKGPRDGSIDVWFSGRSERREERSSMVKTIPRFPTPTTRFSSQSTQLNSVPGEL